MRVSFGERVLSASAYVFGIPALYIVLNGNKKKSYAGSHGVRAFTLWISFLVMFFLVRFSINALWRLSYLPQLEMLETFSVAAMGCCVLYFGFCSLFGKRI